MSQPDSLDLPTWVTGATNYDAGDTSKQWRLPRFGRPGSDAGQEGRVLVALGVECDVLCDDWYLGGDGCRAVKQLDRCWM